MKLPLPPKRFEHINDPKYDPIRPRKWFSRLKKRREKIPALEQAVKSVLKHGSQVTSAIEWGVDERELRDYITFISLKGVDPKTVAREVVFQHVLDAAYSLYCASNAKYHIKSFIEDVSHHYGINPRHVTEAWECDPTFYPSNYL